MSKELYACARLELTGIIRGVNTYECQEWQAVPQSPLEEMAITGSQSVALTASIVTLFLIVKGYKIAMRAISQI